MLNGLSANYHIQMFVNSFIESQIIAENETQACAGCWVKTICTQTVLMLTDIKGIHIIHNKKCIIYLLYCDFMIQQSMHVSHVLCGCDGEVLIYSTNPALKLGFSSENKY